MADDIEAPPEGEGAGAPAAPETPKLITPRDRVMAVVREVADRHGLLVSDLLMGSHESGARRHDRAAARQEAMVLVGERFPHMSTPQIGTFFGGRDHTTVIYARIAHAKRKAEAKRGK
jgi:chromosomal replication initiation ATPase DnaA